MVCEQAGNGGKGRLGSAGMPQESSSWNINGYLKWLHSELLMVYLCTQVGHPVKDSCLEWTQKKTIENNLCEIYSITGTVIPLIVAIVNPVCPTY